MQGLIMFAMGMALTCASRTIYWRKKTRNAGFFLWVDLGPFLSFKDADDNGWEAEKNLVSAITDAGVPLASGRAYQAERPGWFRVLFTVDKDSLEEALKRYLHIPRSLLRTQPRTNLM